MSSRLAPLALFLLLLGPTADAAEPAAQKVANIIPFDLAVCFYQPVTVEPPVNEVTLSALWQLAQPLVRECLVDTRNDVPGKSSAFKLTLTLSDTAYTRTVDSDGLNPTGKKCIDDAIGKISPTLPLPPAGTKPITYSTQLPEVPKGLRVSFGVNEFSDVAAAVRLASPSLCSCFEPYRKSADPAPVNLNVQVTRAPDKFKQPDGGVPAPVVVLVTDGPAEVRSCLVAKLSILRFNTTSDQIVVPFRFNFLNAVAPSPDVSALPDSVKFFQLEAMAGQRAASSQLQRARIVAASVRYNDLVKEYQALSKSNPKKATPMVKSLQTSCADLIKQHDVYISSLEAEGTLQKDMAGVATTLKGKDPTWADAESASQRAVSTTQGLIAKAQEARTNDQKICPKISFK